MSNELNNFDYEEIINQGNSREFYENPKSTLSEDYVVCAYCGFKHFPSDILKNRSLMLMFDSKKERLTSRVECNNCNFENEITVNISFETERS